MKKNKRKYLKLLSIVTIIILSICILTGCAKNDESNDETAEKKYEEPIKNYFEGIKNKNIEQVLSAFPEFAGMSALISSEDLDDLYAQYETIYGANIKIDYTLGEEVELSEEGINDLENEINAIYNTSEEQTIDITAAYTVPVTVVIAGDGIQEDTTNIENTEEGTNTTSEQENNNSGTEESELYVFEYNGNWYIL